MGVIEAIFSLQSDESEREADGFLKGLAVGVVTDNEDPDGLARVRVRLPWHAEGDTSFWARLAMPMAGASRGTYFLPEIGDEVLVGAENGDLSHLYVLGALWNGQDAPPTTNQDGANNERLILSRSGHQLRFHDDESQPEVELRLSDGKRMFLDQNGVLLEVGSNIVKIEPSGAVTIESDRQLKLKSNVVSIEAGASMEIKASGTLTLKGAVVQIN